MQMLEAIFCDVDGTLTGHATKPVDTEIRNHIRVLQKKGVKFGTATSHEFNGKIIKKFSKYYKLDFMVLENGSVIYLREKNGSYSKLRSYEKENKQKLQHLRSLQKYFLRNSKKIKTSDFILTHKGFYKIFYMEKIYLTVHFKKASFLIRTLSSNDDITPVIRILENECCRNKLDLKFIEPSKEFVEIGIANKAEGVKYLADHLDIPLKNVCAIGDADNDIEMLKLVGLPACPADVSKKIKDIINKKHGIIASKNEYLGTRQILRRIAQFKVEVLAGELKPPEIGGEY